jgi:hypothetical protein
MQCVATRHGDEEFCGLCIGEFTEKLSLSRWLSTGDVLRGEVAAKLAKLPSSGELRAVPPCYRRRNGAATRGSLRDAKERLPNMV